MKVVEFFSIAPLSTVSLLANIASISVKVRWIIIGIGCLLLVNQIICFVIWYMAKKLIRMN
jgi:hypothetical protein